MQDERSMILNMLKEGKISVEEADALLEVLAEGTDAEEGGFHAVNSKLGYDDANEVIAIISRSLKSILEIMGIDGAVFCRRPPDKFFISLDNEVNIAILAKLLTTVKKSVELELGRMFGRRFSAG